MDTLWIWASLLAGFFQALRMGSLKELNRHLSTMVATYVRVLFGLPLLLAYLYGVLVFTNQSVPPLNARFLVFSTLAAVTQFAGTALLVRLFQIGNFAVGTMLAKTDVILTAVIGSLLFSESVTVAGWIAILITVAGVMTAAAGRLPAGAWANGRQSLAEIAFGRANRIGLASGLMFALSYLTLREAILALGSGPSPLLRSALAAAAMTGLSFLILGVTLLVREPDGLRKIFSHKRLSFFVGATSALGTVAWFLASALTNVAYVAAVAQVQIVFTLALSRYWFAEPIRRLEVIGIAVILAGVMLFRAI